MKNKIYIFFIILFLCSSASAQTDSLKQTIIYNGSLGFSSGINNMNGILGINGEIRLVKDVFIMGAAGIGSWGGKGSIGIKYYRDFPYRTYFGLYYSGASGLNDFETELDTELEEGKQKVMLDLKRAKNINVIIGYSWNIFKRSRFHLEGGYSIPLQTKAYEVTSNHVLTKESEQALNILTPGGLIVGFGFSVCLK